MRSADCLHERVNAPAALLPRLISQRVVADFAVAVVELIAPPVPGLRAELFCSANHLPDQLLGYSATITLHVRDARAVRLHRAALLVTKGVGENEMGGVTERARDESEGYTRRAGGVLDDRAISLQAAVRGGALDQRTR